MVVTKGIVNKVELGNIRPLFAFNVTRAINIIQCSNKLSHLITKSGAGFKSFWIMESPNIKNKHVYIYS